MRQTPLKKILGLVFFSFLLLWKGSSWADISGTIIPFYIYPTPAAIQPLLDAKSQHPNVPIRVIMNPASGVGTMQDPVYVQAIATLKIAGIQIAGYVNTDYNTRPLSQVMDEIDQWYNWYNPDGIFLDMMGAMPSYYQDLTTHIKSLGMKFSIGNPGMNVDVSYANLVDTVVIANSSYLPLLSNYTNWQNAQLPKTKAAFLIYNIPTLPADFIYQAKSFVGWIYITDQGGMAPWEALPTYFNQLMTTLDTTHVGTMIPFYIYPTQAAIQPLIDAKNQHPNVPIRVILNPNSGVGSSKNNDYVNAIAQLKAAGISVLGYVATNYGNRSKNSVQNEISKWVNWYHPDGIFLDEMALKHAYYLSLTAYAKSLGIQYVVGNPGTNLNTSAGADVDTITIFEDAYLPNLSNFQNWYNAYPSSKISLLAYNISSLPTSFIIQAAEHFDWIYITDDGADGDPWDEYATYFADFIALLDTL